MRLQMMQIMYVTMSALGCRSSTVEWYGWMRMRILLHLLQSRFFFAISLLLQVSYTFLENLAALLNSWMETAIRVTTTEKQLSKKTVSTIS